MRHCNINIIAEVIIFKKMSNSDETSCEYVSSRGLLKMCSHKSNAPVSSQIHVYHEIQFELMKDGDTVYICSSALLDFTNRILPNVKTRFILLSGDSDDSIPCDALNESKFNELINNDFLIAWFSQNLVNSPKKYPKMRFLPIGLDYHTMSNNDMYWGARTSPKSQENELIDVSKKSKPLSERIPIAYTTFHFAIHRGCRRQAFEQIPSNLVYYEPNQISRLESWNKQIEYAFVVSPPGEGLDCHRTWEALCLGCIPIMISTPLDEMFEGLPVLIVKSWSDVTKELLDNTISEYSKIDFSMNKLHLEYWKNQIELLRK